MLFAIWKLDGEVQKAILWILAEYKKSRLWGVFCVSPFLERPVSRSARYSSSTSKCPNHTPSALYTLPGEEIGRVWNVLQHERDGRFSGGRFDLLIFIVVKKKQRKPRKMGE